MTKGPLKAIAGTPDKPLIIGDIEIPCYVLEDETRVLHQRGMVTSLGMSRGSAGGTGGDRLAKFVAGDRLSSFVSKDLIAVTQNPIKFRAPNGSIAYGYEATVLADICDAVLDARNAEKLQSQQMHIAKQCEILVRGFARVGIIALVDEVTGYQEIRSRQALAKILEEFIAKELQPWTKTFPEDFYKGIFRLRGWSYPALALGQKPARPGVVGKYTNDLVYERLAPGVLEELEKMNPVLPKGHRKNRHHQWFTPDLGHPKLKEHLYAVIALMKASSGWDQFMRNMNRSLPRQNDTIELPLDD